MSGPRIDNRQALHFLLSVISLIWFSVPDDVWRVNLDSGKITPPPSQTLEDIPPLPEPEGKTLRSHLRQVS